MSKLTKPIRLIFILVALCIATINTILIFIQIIDPAKWTNFINASNLVLSLVASATVVFIATFTSKELSEKRTYWGLSVAFIFYSLAETVWTIYPIIIHSELPNPSLADLFWIIGTITLISEIILHQQTLERDLDAKSSIVLFSLVGIIVVGLIVLTFGENVILQEFVPEEGFGPIQKAVAIFYFTGDCLLVYAIGLIAFTHINSKELQGQTSWLLLLLGMLSMVIGDTFYTSGVTYIKGTENYLIEDIFYTFQYFFWVLGVATFPMSLEDKKGGITK